MNVVTSLRVHVAPVGFETDRIVIPAEQRKADRVWLMAHNSDRKAKQYQDIIQERLEKEQIEVLEKPHDRMDLFDIIRATREIIQEETNNNIFVNLSSGSKMQAVGCVMACMMFNRDGNVHSYYVEPETYHRQEKTQPLSSGVKQIQDMPKYDIRIPSPIQIETLKIVYEAQSPVRKIDLLSQLRKAGIIMIRGQDDNAMNSHSDHIIVGAQGNAEAGSLASMDQNLVRPLINWGFLDVEKRGRNRYVSLTEAGKNTARFLSGSS